MEQFQAVEEQVAGVGKRTEAEQAELGSQLRALAAEHKATIISCCVRLERVFRGAT